MFCKDGAHIASIYTTLLQAWPKKCFRFSRIFSKILSIWLQIAPVKPPSVPMVVVICCGCCFLQSTIAFVILLPNIYVRRCYISINFALMQFCLSVTATMSFIVLSLLKFLPQVSEPFQVLWFNPNGMSISKYLGTQWISNWKIPRITVVKLTAVCLPLKHLLNNLLQLVNSSTKVLSFLASQTCV